MQAVELENVTRRFGEFVAVDNISLSVKRGEIFGFLGPNGSGKSTTIKMICGILRPSEGNIHVFGNDTVKHRKSVVMKIGYMSQKFSLYPNLTVEENLSFYAGVYGIRGARRRERIGQLLEENNLLRQRDRIARELPVGWKQRLALACSLLHEPEILFLDEPTGGVDPSSRRQFWDIIVHMAEKGDTIFVTTHYMDEAEYCDRIGLIYQGKLIALGAGHELKRQAIPGKVFELTLPDAVSHMKTIGQGRGVREVTVHGRSLHVTFDEKTEDPEAVLKQLVNEGAPLAEWREIAPSLEDVFVTLMK